MRPIATVLGLLALAIALAACSGTSAAPTTPPSTAEPTPSGAPSGDPGSSDEIVVTARDLVFVETDLRVPAATPLTIVLDNQEAAPHNIVISDASGTVFEGEIVSNQRIAYAVPALQAGSYTFICAVHPEMKGTIVAE